MLAGALMPVGSAEARQDIAEVPSVIQVVPVLDDPDSSSGALVVTVIPGDRVPAAVSLTVNLATGTSLVRTGDTGGPACTFSGGFLGACGPANASDQVQLAIFRLQDTIEPVEALRVAFTVLEPGTVPAIEVVAKSISDHRGHPIPFRVESGPVAVSVSVTCGPRELLVASSNLTLRSASLHSGDDVVEATVVPRGAGQGWTVALDPSDPDQVVLTLVNGDGSSFVHAVTVDADAECDSDSDGVDVPADNCPSEANESQRDTDQDGSGDACDTDCDVNGQQIITTIDPVECRALVSFGFAHVGLPHVSPSRCGGFVGVTCDESGRHVIGLRFSEWNEQLSSHIGRIDVFAHLQLLSVSDQGLRSLPPEIGGLTRLRVLDASHNVLASLPDLSALEELTTLYLGNNRFTSVPAAAGQLGLRVLDLRNNEIEQVEAASIGQDVRWLELDNNRITSFPELDRIDLWELGLGRNLLAQPPSLDGLSNLSRLDLRGNVMHGDITEFIRSWLAEERDFGDGFVQLNDGAGGNDCLRIADAAVAEAYLAARLPVLECSRGPAAVSGRVLGIDGLPLFGIEVCIEGLIGVHPCAFTTVTGQFEIVDVHTIEGDSVSLSALDRTGRFDPVSTAEAFALSPGDRADGITLQFLELDDANVDPDPLPGPTPAPILAEGGSIAGVLVDSDGVGVAHATVCAERVFIAGGACTTSSPLGEYVISGLPVGNYRMNASADGSVIAEFAHVGVSRDQHVVGVALTTTG